ncbi:PREDICTED: zinc finger BED domain-containing protein 4-like [Amphimedon queenslandica]|uniref:HAT C-terminal dimerisation domain-containing protein n=1 Tax=Amphimedon queenslandica TaxID=400682 RepID=A0A1X7VEI7_AMPQE|nr:PREDICTED: zinc finger BED domain-containing protein 4-like [Amphimedon queenslandica]|eukprot:XP_011410351.1 PREDICTED: zinc finger BED domain-containing protein 4-like [Amphimedon queenslandica]
MKSAFTMELDDEFPCPTENDESDSEDENTAMLSQWTSQPLSHFEGWIGCAAHQLQLVVHDGYKELLNYRRVQAAFKKAKAICTLSRQSSHFRYALQEKRIPTANETRWNSCNHLTLTITTTDKENLQGVVDVLEYFAEGTDILQRENEPTSCRVIPVVDSLENAINSVPRDNTAINALCEALKNSLEKHFRYLLDSAVHQASTALDPRIKLTFTNSHTEGKFFKFYPTTVKDKIKELLPQTDSIAPPTTEAVSTPTTNDIPLDLEAQPQKKKRLLDFSSVVVHGSSTNENDVELQVYFDHPTLDMKPLTFWCERKVTSLSTLALQLHSVPSSSAPVERLFSKAGIVLSQRRTRLKNEQLEQLLFYK